MRISIIGDCLSAKSLRGLIGASRCLAIVETGAHYTVELLEEARGTILLDSVDGPLSAEILRSLRETAATAITVETSSGVRDDARLRIIVPVRDADRRAVEKGVLRGLLILAGHSARGEPDHSLWRKFFGGAK